MWFETTRVFLTAGKAHGGTALNAFDNALREAGVADFNLIRVTSIIPPQISVEHLVNREIKGRGLLIPAVYETISSKKRGTRISAAVGVGVTERESGMIFSYSNKGSRKEIETVVCKMVDEGMKAKGHSKYNCEVASASVVVSEAWACVFASVVFCERDTERMFFGKSRRK